MNWFTNDFLSIENKIIKIKENKMEDNTTPMSISFDPENLTHINMMKYMLHYEDARIAIFDFRNVLRRAINKGEFPSHLINQTDEDWRPTEEEVCKSADVIWNLLNDCFERYDAEEFLKES